MYNVHGVQGDWTADERDGKSRSRSCTCTQIHPIYMYDVDTEAEIWNLNSHNNQYPLNLLAQLFFNQMKWVDGV